MLEQPEKSKSNSLGNFFRRHLAESLLQFIKAFRQYLADVVPDLRVFGQILMQSVVLPDQCLALLHCARRAGMAATGQLARNPYCIARSIHPKDDFISVWAELSTLYTS